MAEILCPYCNSNKTFFSEQPIGNFYKDFITADEQDATTVYDPEEDPGGEEFYEARLEGAVVKDLVVFISICKDCLGLFGTPVITE